MSFQPQIEIQAPNHSSFQGPGYQPPAGGFGSGPQGQFGPQGYYGPGFMRGPMGATMSSDRLALTAMILGVLSIPATSMCMMGLPLGIVAICLSVHAKKKIANEPHLHHGLGLAKAGFWCGIAGIALMLLYVGFFAISFARL